MRESLYIAAATLAVLAAVGVAVLATVRLTARDEMTAAGMTLCQLARSGGAYDRLETFAEQEAPPLSQLLTPEDKIAYESLIDSGQCIAARELIKGPYLRRFSDQDCFFEDVPLMEIWRVFVVNRRYKGLALCFHEAEARSAIKRMMARGEKIPVYDWNRAMGRTAVSDPSLKAREEALKNIELMCMGSYQPACIVCMELDSQYGVFELNPARVKLMLQWARQSGVDSPRLQRLLRHYSVDAPPEIDPAPKQ